ncbi:aaa-atpase [Quercus suber]|uniref:Aaa-atpase n=1 Tax=Quercus suber TaxID=58331 RepID=A0AAW0JWX2_QUESU
MANFLSYDVYDIDVSKVSKVSDLNSLLLGTTSHSIIVIEDFDRFLMEKPRTENLSMIMKFMNGILNSCIAEERLMVFTMNSKEHLLIKMAVLRPGRIDIRCNGITRIPIEIVLKHARFIIGLRSCKRIKNLAIYSK